LNSEFDDINLTTVHNIPNLPHPTVMYPSSTQPVLRRGVYIFSASPAQSSLALVGTGRFSQTPMFNNCAIGVNLYRASLDMRDVQIRFESTALLPPGNVTLHGVLIENSLTHHISIFQNRIIMKKGGRCLGIITSNQGQRAINENYFELSNVPNQFGAMPTSTSAVVISSPTQDTSKLWDMFRADTIRLGAGTQHGITIDGSENYWGVLDNVISRSTNPTLFPSACIYVNTDTLWVSCNVINGAYNTSNMVANPGFNAGILLGGNAKRGGIYCNSLDSTSNGISLLPNGVGQRTNIWRNEFGFHRVGLRLGGSAAIGIQHNAENQWLGNCRFGAINENTGSPGASRFEVDSFSQPFVPQDTLIISSYPSVFIGGIQDQNKDWFTDNVTGVIPSYQCSMTMGCQPGVVNLVPSDPVLLKIAQGDYETPEFEEPVNWRADKQLFDLVTTEIELRASEYSLDSFYQANQNNDLKIIQDLEQIATRSMLNAGDNDLGIARFKERIAAQSSLIDSTMLVMAETEDSLLYSDLTHQLENLKSSYDSLNLSLDSLYTLNRSENLALLQDNYNSFDVLDVDKLYIDNERRVGQLLYAALMREDFFFTESEKIELEEIAQSCVLAGGPAVDKARSLVIMYKDTSYDDATKCAQIGIPYRYSSDNEQMESGIYPNPTAGEVNIKLPENLIQPAIYIFDVTGRLVKSPTCEYNRGVIRFTVFDLPVGIYWVSVRDVLHSKVFKLIVARNK
jgi:hypothetical protein